MPARRCRLLIAIIDLDGGSGVFCRTLATALKRYFRNEFEISLLLCRSRSILPSDYQLFDRIRILYTAVHTDRRRYYESILHAVRMHNAIGQIGTDVILTVGTYANLLVPFASPRRTILTVHSNTTKLLGESMFGGLIAQLLRWRYPRNIVVSPSQGVAEDLVQNFNVRRVRVIPHGVDAENIRALAEQPADVPPGNFIVACGNFTVAKDYPTMIRAYALARQAGLTEDLVIIGDGEERAKVQQLIRELKVCAHVHLLGHRENPYGYMKPAKFFVMSSIWEGFGLALVEAMTLGLPCIATDCPSGPPEILAHGKHGILVPPSNPPALADAMVKFANSPKDLAFFAEQSTMRAQDFSLERMGQEYRDLLVES
jgi:glycosyltransferase involved in cell wall biosynthesis